MPSISSAPVCTRSRSASARRESSGTGNLRRHSATAENLRFVVLADARHRSPWPRPPVATRRHRYSPRPGRAPRALRRSRPVIQALPGITAPALQAMRQPETPAGHQQGGDGQGCKEAICAQTMGAGWGLAKADITKGGIAYCQTSHLADDRATPDFIRLSRLFKQQTQNLFPPHRPTFLSATNPFSFGQNAHRKDTFPAL